MDSYYCGARVAYRFCCQGVGSYCGKNEGASGAGFNMNRSMYLGHDNWLVTNGISSMTIGPYDPAERGAVVFYGYNGCSNQSSAFYAHEDPEK